MFFLIQPTWFPTSNTYINYSLSAVSSTCFFCMFLPSSSDRCSFPLLLTEILRHFTNRTFDIYFVSTLRNSCILRGLATAFRVSSGYQTLCGACVPAFTSKFICVLWLVLPSLFYWDSHQWFVRPRISPDLPSGILTFPHEQLFYRMWIPRAMYSFGKTMEKWREMQEV